MSIKKYLHAITQNIHIIFKRMSHNYVIYGNTHAEYVPHGHRKNMCDIWTSVKWCLILWRLSYQYIEKKIIGNKNIHVL